METDSGRNKSEKACLSKRAKWGIGIFFSLAIIAGIIGVLVWKFALTGSVRMQFAKFGGSEGNHLFRLLDYSSYVNITPSVVEMKLIALYLAEDVDPTSQNNIGKTEMVWLNPDCTSIDSCTVR